MSLSYADKSFLTEVKERSEQNLDLCYQCLKCYAGCPVSRHMDYKPNNVIRMIQYGRREAVLKSHAIWLCVSCMTCGVRCPNEIDMSEVMDTLREMSLEEGLAFKSEAWVVKLHQEFLRSVKLWGRLHEVTFFVAYMLRSFDLFSNMASGIKLFSRGKLPFFPKKIGGIDEIRKLFKGAYKTKGQLEEEE